MKRQRVTATPPKNSVRVDLQGLTSFGKTGILHQDNEFFSPRKIRVWKFHARIEEIASPWKSHFHVACDPLRYSFPTHHACSVSPHWPVSFPLDEFSLKDEGNV